MKKFLLVGASVLLLQGCFPAAVATGGAAGMSVGSDQRTLHTMKNDEQIAYQLERQIAADKELQDNANVSVVSFNQVVLLVGQTPTEAMRQKVVDMAQAEPDVHRVFNEITIGKPTSAMQRSKDAAITTNVKARMFATTNLNSGRFKVVTEDQTVYLLGITTRKQANMAANTARDSTGVKKVVKLVQYTTEPDNDS